MRIRWRCLESGNQQGEFPGCVVGGTVGPLKTVFVLPLIGVVVATSCSRFFGLPKMAGVPQITFDRIALLVLLLAFATPIVIRPGRG